MEHFVGYFHFLLQQDHPKFIILYSIIINYLFIHFDRAILEFNYFFTTTRVDHYSGIIILCSLCNVAFAVIIKDDLLFIDSFTIAKLKVHSM